MPIYQAYAPFYDGSGQIRFALLMGQYLSELLQRHPVTGRRALDLACGTGTLACILADDGWQVVGLDGADPMLQIARARAEELPPGQALFVLGDIRRSIFEQMDAHRHEPLPPFDLVTCTYDSLNYLLTLEDLACCFAAAAAALAPGGLLIADMNTRYFLEHDWPAAEALERPGFIQVSQSYFDPATDCSTMVLTGFVGNDISGYERFDEIHIERAYAPALVAKLLADAGLRVEASYDCFTFQPVHERTQRIAWLARKPAQAQRSHTPRAITPA